jgi:hypothetical protein
MWPREEDDFMEIGNTGWIPAAEGWFYNKHTGNSMDEIGREYDASGKLIYDPNDEVDPD